MNKGMIIMGMVEHFKMRLRLTQTSRKGRGEGERRKGVRKLFNKIKANEGIYIIKDNESGNPQI